MNKPNYVGNGAANGSVYHSELTLRSHLSKNYDIIRIDHTALLREPWQETTALLVFPGGRDLPYMKDLSPKATSSIRKWVKEGGRYLGICAGAYFASRRCEFEVDRPAYEVIGDRDLNLSNAVAKGSVIPGFVYGSESGSKSVAIELGLGTITTQPAQILNAYVNGGPWFDLPSNTTNEIILGWYLLAKPNATPDRLPAIIQSKLGSGMAILSGPHIEYDPSVIALSTSSVSSSEAISDQVHVLSHLPSLLSSNKLRVQLFRDILDRLGLKLNAEEFIETSIAESLNPQLTPTTLCSLQESFFQTFFCKTIKDAPVITVDSTTTFTVIPDTQNTFALVPRPLPAHNSQLDTKIRNWIVDAPNARPGITIYYDPAGKPPPPSSTPKFNIESYFSHLSQQSKNSTFGTLILYAEIATSTQTILEKNLTFQEALPSGTLFVASHQTAGRGRGKNHWISQTGCLMFSQIVRHTDASNVIFIQYLAALAVIESLQKIWPACAGRVRIKWPNDIYAFSTLAMNDDLSDLRNFVKIGGVLVTSNFIRGQFVLVVGVGLNVCNGNPTICIRDIVGQGNGGQIVDCELVLAGYAGMFGSIYAEFCGGRGFEVFERRYYDSWLHSNQIVTIGPNVDLRSCETLEISIASPIKVRIVGVDVSSGLLKAIGLLDQRSYLLQPDGNSFDMFAGLISRKL